MTSYHCLLLHPLVITIILSHAGLVLPLYLLASKLAFVSPAVSEVCIEVCEGILAPASKDQISYYQFGGPA